MLTEFLPWILLALSIATGLVAGILLGFSDFIMPSLLASRPAAGTEAMQIINRKVYRSIFMVLFIGLTPISLAVAGYGALNLPGTVGGLTATAGLLYLLGVFAVTAAGNVPMNNRLEAMPQAGAEAQAYWPGYVSGWLRFNNVRWVAGLASAATYAAAAILSAGMPG